MKSQMVALQGTMSDFAETNINWTNFTFQDRWVTLLQCSYTNHQCSHSSCDKGHHRILQCSGISMVCNHWLGAKLMEKGGDISLGHWSRMKFQGKQGSKVLVSTTHQITQTSAKGLRLETVYMQQLQKLVKTRNKCKSLCTILGWYH